MSNETETVTVTNEDGTTRERKKPVFRFKNRMTPIETAIFEVCAEQGLSPEAAKSNKRVINKIVSAAMEGVRDEAIQERLDDNPQWLKAQLKAALAAATAG